jgi:hypothetical protein
MEGLRQVVTIYPPLPPPVDDPVLDVENCRRALGELLAAFIARHPEQCALVAFDRGGGAHMPDEAARRGSVSRAAILEPEA